MWLKKLFNPTHTPKPAQQQENIQNITKFADDGQVYNSTVTIDIEPDLRYKQYKEIPRDISIKFPSTTLHNTENILIYEVNLCTGATDQNEQWKQIDILVTDRQILITPNIMETYGKNALKYFSMNFGSIEKCQLQQPKKKDPLRLKIILKNSREIYIKCVIGDLINKIYEILNNFAFVKGVNKFYAYRFGTLNKNKEQQYKGWKVYNIKREFLRQGLFTEDQGGLNLKYINNENGQISQTYPQLLVIPSKVTDEQLKKCAQFRTKQRFPALTYILEYKPHKYTTLFRCSQNKVGVLYSRSKEDELMIQYIGDLTGSFFNIPTPQEPKRGKNCKIYDARGYYAALGNMIAGKGYEKAQFYTNCQVEWLNIPNIHAVRDSYYMMMNYRQQYSNFFILCAQSGWYDYLYLIIAGAKSIAKDLLNGMNVVVHCSDGWDRTSQLCALSQLIIDPYYRTIQGFAVLVEKDWRHFGHKFRSRTAQYNAIQSHPYEKSPIFIQFLDCVFQIIQQFPLSFQYNQRLLGFLAQNLDSNVYGTFMANNIKQCKQLKLQQNTISIWSYIFQNIPIYKNPYYVQELGQFWLNVGTEPKHMTAWRSLFLGDNITSNIAHQIMRHEVDMKNILHNRYSENALQIERLTKKLETLGK